MSRREKFRFYEVLPVQFLLYLVLRHVDHDHRHVPLRMAPVIAAFLGGIIRTIDRKHVRIAAKNLEKSNGVCPPGQIPAFTPEGLRKRGPGLH